MPTEMDSTPRHTCTDCDLPIEHSAHEVAAISIFTQDPDYYHRGCWQTKVKREASNKQKWFKGTGLL